MKKTLFLSAIALLILLAGCGIKPEEKEDEKPIMTATPEEVCGVYTDEIAKRAMMEVEGRKISLTWLSSYDEVGLYSMSTDYDPENNQIRYSDGILIDRVYTSENEYTDNEKYNDGTGYFEVEENKLIWHDEKENRETVFIKVDSVLFTPCETLKDAIEKAGVDFEEPADESYPMRVNKKVYFASEGCILIVSDGETQTVNIGKAKNPQILARIFDSSAYSNSWKENIKGLNVDCYSNSDKIQLATFNNGSDYYGIGYYVTSDAQNGLSIDDIQSLIMGMQ